MGRTHAYLGIDVGTSSVKALLVDAAGRVLATGAERIPLIADDALQAEEDAQIWWQATVSAVRSCLGGTAGVRLEAVGLTGQKHAFLPLDVAGRPLTNAVLWADGRATVEAAEMRSVFPAAARRTGLLPQPGFLIPKWLRFLRSDPECAARTAKLIYAKDWLRLRLTGSFATDRTEASSSQAYDFRRDSWSESLMRVFDLRPDTLPIVHPSTAQAGTVNQAGSDATGIPMGTPVVAGAGDNEAAAVGCGALGGGRVAVILGTSGTVVGWAKRRATAGGLSWNRHVLKQGYASTGTVLSAGRALRWVRRLAFGRDFDLAQVLEAAAATDPHVAPLVFLPSLVGERSPVPDPLATGAFVGLRPQHGRGHLARAVIDGVSLALAEVLVLMRGAGVSVSQLRITSGGGASRLWRRTIAAAAGVPVVRIKEREGPALGAAMLAAAMVGRGGTLPELIERWVQAGPPEEPDPQEAERLQELGTRLRAVRNALRGVQTRAD